MSGTSLSHFLKHLSCKLCCQIRSPRLLHSSQLAAFSSFSSNLLRYPSLPTSRKLGGKWRPFYFTASFSLQAAAAESSSANSGIPPYCSALIRCRKDVADNLSEALLSFGASSVSMDDHEDYDNSDEVCLCSIFTGGEDVDICISHAAYSVGLEEKPTFEILKYNPYDWIKRTQESFDPVEVTKGLWIVPECKSPPDMHATNIFINPGLAFGTGEHATTKLCLLLLYGTIKGGEAFLDYGTGSGILSIAALKLGASLSVGLDIDPQAISAAHENAALNKIGSDKLKLHLVPERDPDTPEFVEEALHGKNTFDVVIANILLNPLMGLADDIIAHGKAGAVVGLSGVLSEQVPRVIERYSQFLDDISVSEMDDWACVSGRKK